MSAKACDTCGEQIIFGKDVESGKTIPLDNMVSIYHLEGGDKVRFVSNGYRARHRCSRHPVVDPPPPEKSFTEPEQEILF